MASRVCLCAALALLVTTGCDKIVQRLRGDAGEGQALSPPVAEAGVAASPPLSSDDDAPPTTTATAKPGTPTRASAKTPASPSTPSSPAQLETSFKGLDINADNQLDGIEVKNCGCAVADANGDGEITKAEYLAAGLLGKFKPGAPPTISPITPSPPAPSPTPPPSPTPAPAPAQVAAGGVPPGSYKCFGTVGTFYGARGTLVILDATRYAHGSDGSGGGNYTFNPATKKLRFTSGLFADPNSVSDATQISPTHIQMRTGKGGFYLWDCKR